MLKDGWSLKAWRLPVAEGRLVAEELLVAEGWLVAEGMAAAGR